MFINKQTLIKTVLVYNMSNMHNIFASLESSGWGSSLN